MRWTKLTSAAVSVLAILSSLVLGVLSLLDGWRAFSDIYQFPKLINKSSVVLGIVISALIFVVNILLALLLRPKKRRGNILKITAIVALCLAFLVSTNITSLFMLCESRTDDMQAYLCFDTKSAMVDKTKEFFPKREDVEHYAEEGAKIKYDYQFSYPILSDAYEYDVRLSLNFGENNMRFIELYDEVIENADSIVTEIDGVACVMIVEKASINDEPVILNHKIMLDKTIGELTYIAELELLE